MRYKIIFILSISLFITTIRYSNAQAVDTYNYTGAIVNWTVPSCVISITVDVRGAQGGNYNRATGGLGARMQGVFNVTPGDVLTIWVGGQGTSSQNAGGGGGGSGITKGAIPLIIAGGGGGCSEDLVNGLPGLTSTSGGSSS